VKTVRIALGAAALWSVGLVVAALIVPVYSGESERTDSTGSASSTATSATLVEVNGWWGLVLASIPLVACLVVGALLLGGRGRPATIAALVVVGLLGVLTVLSLLSVGLFLAPAVAALGVAVLVAPGAPAEGRRPAGGAA
jgi:hypothetical protein